MAKVGKMTIGRGNRFLVGYNYGQGQSMVVESAPEFSEDDVWSVVGDWAERASAHRRVPKEGGLSSAFNDPSKTTASSKNAKQSRPRGRQMAASVPLSVPDWSKIYRVGSVESMQDSDDYASDYDSEMVPPHEYLARKMAANSVMEGVGRTLKGRDMSRVRDAVWSQTGFDG